MNDLSMFTNPMAKPECLGVFVSELRGCDFGGAFDSLTDDDGNLREASE
jgi:hypothetical protein